MWVEKKRARGLRTRFCVVRKAQKGITRNRIFPNNSCVFFTSHTGHYLLEISAKIRIMKVTCILPPYTKIKWYSVIMKATGTTIGSGNFINVNCWDGIAEFSEAFVCKFTGPCKNPAPVNQPKYSAPGVAGCRGFGGGFFQKLMRL